jgi:predicted metal-dependent peptidase
VNEVYSSIQRAEGVIKRAMARLAEQYPYHTAVLVQLRIVALPAITTMAVTVSRGQVLLLHNPIYVLSLPADELGGVLLHEVHHLIMKHLTIDPADWDDRWALTVAMEVSANELIAEPLPEGAILLEQFPTLPPLESTPERYARLVEIQDRVEIDLPALEGGEEWGELIEAALAGVVDTDSASGSVPGDQPRTLDNHAVWQEALKDRDGAMEAIASVLQQAALETNVPQDLRSALRSQGIGIMPGEMTYQLQRSRSGQLDWRRLLRRYIGQVLEPRPVYNYPPRRFPHLLGIFPGNRTGHRPTVLCVIDTSGSIEDDHLEMIDAELRLLSRSCSIHIVECDSEIRRVTRYCRRLQLVTGRGGTDLRPPLERAFLRRFCPGVVIYFTDGEGPAPENPPAIPVIWCLVHGGKPPAPWGRVVWMGPPMRGNEPKPSFLGRKKADPGRKKTGRKGEKQAAFLSQTIGFSSRNTSFPDHRQS